MALTTTGQVYAWGSNTFGQLGNGSVVASDVPVPIDAPGGVTFTAIAAGGDHSLALSSTGQVYAWGANFDGQLGDGTTTSSDLPALVTAPPDTDFTAIAAGTAHSLALSSTGVVYAWGYNGSGQLGDGSDESSSTMTAVTFPPGVLISAIACGADHSLALSSTGAVYEWGSDVFGQLDTALVDSAPVDSPVPVQPLGLPPLTTFVAVAGGLDSSYALTSAGVVWSWGGNPYGQLGSGPPGVDAVLPAPLDSVPAGTLATGRLLRSRRRRRLPGDSRRPAAELPAAARADLRRPARRRRPDSQLGTARRPPRAPGPAPVRRRISPSWPPGPAR